MRIYLGDRDESVQPRPCELNGKGAIEIDGKGATDLDGKGATKLDGGSVSASSTSGAKSARWSTAAAERRAKSAIPMHRLDKRGGQKCGRRPIFL